MTNKEILSNECALNNITEPINTFMGWRKQGLSVKRGNKAIFTTRIWKPVKTTNKKTGEKESKLILVKASFFTKSQVKPIKEAITSRV